MAWRLNHSIVRGELDNRVKGEVTGRIWLMGQEDPVELRLLGDCLRDIAGCLIEFENMAPRADELVGLDVLQEGVVGDITASRKVRILGVSPEKARDLRKSKQQVPGTIANCLYVEWFSETNGRVVVESTEYEVTISMHEWRMTREESVDQKDLNQDAFKEWMERLADEGDLYEEDFDDYEPMNEFEWEQRLRESDALTDKFSAVLEKYMDHPDRDKLVAREMGWTWLEEAIDAEERGVFEREELDFDDIDPLEPNPVTEGVDWIRTDRGRITHPLAAKAYKTAMDMWHFCDGMGLLKDDQGDEDLRDMIFRAQTLSAKLAGALNGLAYDPDVEGGFIVAHLKRALRHFDGAIEASKRVRENKLLSEERLDEFCSDLFRIRQDMLGLMARFRQKHW